MSDRTVVVRLIAEVGQYQQQMAAAGRATDRLALQTKKTEKMIGSSLGSIRGMITTFGVPLVGASLIKSFMDFEQQMARVKAVGDPFGQSTRGAKQLHDAALQAGQAYGFTATETAQAMEELAKAGMSTGDILDGVLNSALTLAAAGSIGLADAAKHIAVIRTQFELFGKEDPTRIANQLAKAANATVSGVDEMATSLSYVGPIAHSMGMGLEDTVTTLSLFNAAGLDADMAGTTLRGLLTSLTSPSHLAASEMGKLNLQLYDGNGKMKSIAGITDELSTKIGGLSDEEKSYVIGKIASNAQLQGALILMKAGSKGLSAMARLISIQASAEDVAKAKTASFTGEIKKLGAAIETSAIKSMEKLIPLMGPIVTHARDMTTWFGNLGGGAQLAAVGLAAQLIMARRVTSGMGSFSGAIQKASQDSVTYKQALDSLERRKSFDVPTKQFSQVTDNLRSTVTQMEASREESGRVKWAMGEMGASVSGAASKSQKAAATFTGSMKVMGAGAMSLMDFMGGPWGIAIGASLLIFGKIAEDAAKAKARQEELAQTLADLGAAYQKFGTTSGQSTEALISKDKTLRDVARHTKEFGVSIESVVKASAGEADQQRKVIGALKARSEALRLAALTHKPSGELFDIFREDKAAKALWDQKHAVDNLSASLQKEFKDQQAIADAMQQVKDVGLGEYIDKMGLTFSDVNPMMSAMAENANVLGAEQATAADKTKALKSNLDLLHGSLNAVSDAMGTLRGTSLRDTFYEKISAKQAVEAVKGRQVADYKTIRYTKPHKAQTRQVKTRDPITGKMVTRTETVKPAWNEPMQKKIKVGSHTEGAKSGKAAEPERFVSKLDLHMIDEFNGKFKTLVKVNGKFNEDLTQSSIKFNSVISEKSAKTLEVVEAVFNSAQQSGASVEAAATTASLQYGKLRKELTDQLEPLFRTRQEAEKLVDAYMVMPEHIQTAFGQPGMAEAIRQASELGITIDQIPGKKAVYLRADTEEGVKRLKELGGKVNTLPDGQITIEFPTWDDALKKFAEMDKTHTPDIIPNVKWQVPTERVLHPKDKFRVPKSDKFTQGIEYDMKVRVTMGIDANTVNLSGGVVNMQTPAAKKNRWGGITTAADGSLREAKIAAGGQSLYQWAEKETGGEAFIPRYGDTARSLSILAQAAAWYGQQVVPAGAMPAAAGAARPMAPLTSVAAGMAAPAPAPVQVRVWLGNEELTDRVRVQIDRASQASALQAAWGRRA